MKQGCNASLFLFSLFIDCPTHSIDGNYGMYDRSFQRGIEVAGFMLHLHLFADDIVLLGQSIEGLQKLLNSVDLFCRDNGLIIFLFQKQSVCT